MQLDFWLNKWQNKDIGFHQEAVNQSLMDFWPRLDLGNQGRVLVPLCGKTQDMLWLAGQGHDVVGVEISPIAVQEFFAENRMDAAHVQMEGLDHWSAGTLRLICGDFFATTNAVVEGVTAVFDRAALIALPPELRRRYAAHLSSLLPYGTDMLLIAIDYPPAEMDGPPFSVNDHEVNALYGENYRISSLAERDVLDENPRFRERGLTRMIERVYRLTKLS
ncbi:thiopurine S-methyltransferase [Methylicorpusculum oleiharenae]|uniref:thiopurine S-methyltransferase n=1 Tax=Methylicorpusculum oleiharenae TaxID=1338687 RepID=UPI00135BD5F6|nr:thiopurine S-methyltransferase [Methylicorpusculum oleiharenae]